MAYVSKEDKAKIVAAVKAVLPKGWKATFAVRNYSAIVCTIRSAPLDLDQVLKLSPTERLNNCKEVFRTSQCKDEAFSEIIGKILDALNTDNYDNSDAMTDYFDVGHYVELRFGEWDKPFKDSRK